MILAMQTANPETEIAVLSENGAVLAEKTWTAGRTLARDLLSEIEQLLVAAGADSAAPWRDVTGLIVFRGPGSFTGLRIGIAVANAIVYANHIPAVGVGGDNWRADGLTRIQNHDFDQIILPEYGAPAHITIPKK
jgi:tRNA threonylcarbamoyladenosine biosynthesis protein TsaB